MHISIKIFLLLWSLVGRAYCSFGGSHDHSHDHDHSDDPHSGHFCWDISQWGEIFYKEIEIPCSDTNFEMKCRDVPKTVTEEVTDTVCDLELYTECKMREEPMPFSKTEETIEEFEKLSCTMVPEVQQHTKTRPNCRNETKWNCISDWVLNEQGEKVFQKVGNCIPMTWLNCTLEEYQVPFTIMRPNCTSDGTVCWKNCTTVPETKMMPNMECEIKSTTRCERVPRQVTKTITFKECGEEMIETKTAKKVKIPCQKKLHRKQCLLSQDAEEDQDSTPIDEDDASIELVRCADDPPGTEEGRLGVLKPQQRDEVKSESNPIPSYGLPSAPPLQEPVQTYKSVDTLYGAPPAAPREYERYTREYPSQTYQSSYQDAVPANLIRKRAVIKGEDAGSRYPRTTRFQVPGHL